MTHQHPLPMDSFTDNLMRGTKYMLENLRYFRSAKGQSIYTVPEQYSFWEVARGTAKSWVKWLGPVFTNSTAKNRAAKIFGKEPSPIAALGDRPVSAYIRYLLFGRGWSQDMVSHHLIQSHGYDYISAQPMIRRILREEEAENTRGKQSAYYLQQRETDMFPEGVVNHVGYRKERK